MGKFLLLNLYNYAIIVLDEFEVWDQCYSIGDENNKTLNCLIPLVLDQCYSIGDENDDVKILILSVVLEQCYSVGDENVSETEAFKELVFDQCYSIGDEITEYSTVSYYICGAISYTQKGSRVVGPAHFFEEIIYEKVKTINS